MDEIHWIRMLVYALLVGIGSNLDDVSVGLAYGVNRVRIPHWVVGLVSLIGLFASFVGTFAGTTIARFIPQSDARWCACIVLCSIGALMIYASYLRPKSSNHRPVFRKPGIRQALLLGLGLSFTDLASGFGATVSNVATWWMNAISIAIWGYIAIWIGNVAGDGWISTLLGRYAPLFAGCLLIGIGVFEVF